ncbi:uncharacterized protein BJ212DRAFT_1446997 [Suillus subaureus]|uniref:Uncharacterized protein n=1 Tax=Suillus subaureus TaxID=48587 RepID=A0A9P7EB80_9AGAM|nr:uncharacterized protein BJ212DRAFT_1446997 [Suillus subaureus]KAG1815919.1 hypothetical protein BJ212DRAFT_1446997 [Suillus subaureus]
MHLMFLTTANIYFCSLLQAHVWHWCVDIICKNLKIMATTGTSMVDPSSHLHYAFTPLVAHTADLPEQQMIVCISENASPITLAIQSQFGDGILYPSHHGSVIIEQMTGWEHQDIQHMIVTTITGIADVHFICAIHVLIDFIYQAQSPTFIPSSITAMTSLLAEFHCFKGAIIDTEAHRGTSSPIKHFKIPKLELLTSFIHTIPNLGAPIQFTSETSEHMLITHCKSPFMCTSHQHASFTQQIVHLLDWEDTACQFDLYTLLCLKTLSLNNLIGNKFEEVVDIDLVFGWVMHVTPKDVSHFHGPHPVCNHFLKGLLSKDSTVLRSFIECINGSESQFQNHLLKVWYKFCLQLHSDLYPHLVMPSQQIQAYPLSEAYPLRNCDIMLLQIQNDEQVVVVQVQMVFTLSMRGSTLPPKLAEPLLYVQLSYPDDPAVMMYRVRRWFETSPDGTLARLGMIVPLIDVTHAVKLIPEYGERVNCDVTSATSLELYDTFYLNSFSDKEWYHSLHADFW